MVTLQFSPGWASSDLDGVWQWNPTTDEFVVCARWHTLVGSLPYPDASTTIASWNMLVHPEDSDDFHAGLDLLIEGGQKNVQAEVRVWHTAGYWIWVLHRAEHISDCCLRGSIQDITRRMQQEALLYETPLFTASIKNVSGVGGWQFDLLAKRMSWSTEMYSIYGLSPHKQPTLKEVMGHFPESARVTFKRSINAAIRTQTALDVELPIIRENGQRILVHCIATIEYESGQPVRLNGAICDITNCAASRVLEMQNNQLQLERANERLSIATRSGGIGIWDFRLDTGEFHWNEQMFEMYGLNQHDDGQIDPLIWLGFLFEQDRSVVLESARSLIITDAPKELDFKIIRADGSTRYMHGTAKAVRDSRGRAVRLVGTNRDVTESHRIARELARQHELLQITMRSIGDGVITTDQVGKVLWLNPVAESMIGWDAVEAKGKAIDDVFETLYAESRERAPNPVLTCLARNDVVGLSEDTLLLTRYSTECFLEVSAAPIRYDDGEVHGAVLIFHDVTERRSLADEMTWRATHDTLTGLLNRSEFELRLTKLHALLDQTTDQHALLFIDLDHFKIINDTSGHAAGDELLQQVAQMLKESVRSQDTLVRLGGDEFAVILEQCPIDDARRIAACIRERMERFRFVHLMQRFRISASIGLVPINRSFIDVSAIVRSADQACYAAKESGRNQVHVWCESDQAVNARHAEIRWATRLETALDDGGFQLFAQRIVPISGLASATQRHSDQHAEVLLRLEDDNRTPILPGAFLPAAERFKLIYRIDQWVLCNVISWLSANKAQVDIGTLWVNLSGQSVGDKRFQAEAIVMLSEAGSDICHALCFEITETAAVTNLSEAAAFITELRELGVRVALDDFGAGASSFGYLKTLPVDFLKIDGQFVRNLIDNPLDAAAVRCFTEVATVMGIKTVAEFVETVDVLDQLKIIGIDYVQGWLLHKPAPISDLLCEQQYVVTA